jgi:hypothetical protein
MASVDSNADQVAAALGALVGSFDFTRPGKDQSLGRDLARTVARGIQRRSVPGATAPDGSSWAANEPEYARRKRAKYAADQPGIRTGQMLSLESLVGETTVAPDSVEMRYGTGEPPRRAANGAELTKGDAATTDRAKAGYFTDSGRPFYGLDAEIAGECRALAAEALKDHLSGK